MLDLDAERAAQQPWWFTLHAAVGDRPAVRVQFAPIGRIALRAARRAAGACYQGADLPDDDNAPLPLDLIEMAGDALSDSLLRSGIIDWEGVGDAAGEPVPLTDDNLRLLLADPSRFEALDAAYVRPFVERELEKNGLSPSPNGISAGAMPGQDIADPSAKPIAMGVAEPKVKKKAVPTGSRKRAPKRASASGTS